MVNWLYRLFYRVKYHFKPKKEDEFFEDMWHTRMGTYDEIKKRTDSWKID